MPNRVCEILKIKYPVVQGPLYFLTDAKLVAGVSNAGGLGCLGFNAGQSTTTIDPQEKYRKMKEEIQAVRKLTDKPFGLNIASMSEPEDKFADLLNQLVLEEKVPVIVMAGPVNPDLIKHFKSNGVTVICRPLNPSVKEAQKAEEAGADIIIATGFDEGGTLPCQCIGTFSIVPTIVDSVKTPIMAAGGVCDRRTFNAAFALGAEGVFCGTLFLMSEESRMAKNIKEKLINIDCNNLLLFRTIPYYYRSIPCPLGNELVEMDKKGATNEELGKVMRGLTNMRLGMLEGNLEKGYVSVGNGIGLIKSIRTCEEIIKELVADYKE